MAIYGIDEKKNLIEMVADDNGLSLYNTNSYQLSSLSRSETSFNGGKKITYTANLSSPATNIDTSSFISDLSNTNTSFITASFSQMKGVCPVGYNLMGSLFSLTIVTTCGYTPVLVSLLIATSSVTITGFSIAALVDILSMNSAIYFYIYQW